MRAGQPAQRARSRSIRSSAVTCAAVKTGEVGVAFNSGAMTVSGGTAPYTYSIVGHAAGGLALNTTTGAVTGTPTASGTFSVQVKDAGGATSTACPITINSAAVGDVRGSEDRRSGRGV